MNPRTTVDGPAQRGSRDELVALWRTLAARGATVSWHDIDALPDDVVDVLCTSEARRIRAIAEGEASGWAPGWRRSATTFTSQTEDLR